MLSLLPLFALLFAACSNEMRYDMLHDTAKRNCRDNPNVQERMACEKSYDRPYSDFESLQQYPEKR